MGSGGWCHQVRRERSRIRAAVFAAGAASLFNLYLRDPSFREHIARRVYVLSTGTIGGQARRNVLLDRKQTPFLSFLERKRAESFFHGGPDPSAWPERLDRRW